MTTIITYEQLKQFYDDFKSAPPEDPAERFTQELRQIRLLIKAAKEKELKDDVFEYQKIEKSAVENLEKMGYTVENW